MNTIWKDLYQALLEGKDVELSTITNSTGSTPRGAGSRMLVFADDLPIGTVGGGAVEFQSQTQSKEAIVKKQSFFELFRLSPNKVADLGMICGGDVDIHFQYFAHEDEKIKTFLKEMLEKYICDPEAFLITKIAEDGKWEMYLCKHNQVLLESHPFNTNIISHCIHQHKKVVEVNNIKYYVERISPSGTVYIFGGGHVGQSLLPVLSKIDFPCVLIENREEFAMKELFKEAIDIKLVNNYEDLDDFKFQSQDYIIIMTRGHQSDYEVLKNVLHQNIHYIGMIGSKAKIKKTYDRLYEIGFSKEDTDKIYAPIGLDIKAETPNEIAISIAAQLIQIRAAL